MLCKPAPVDASPRFRCNLGLSIVSERLRVLMLATYFPKPGNPLMGTWALSQAQALQRQDLDIKVVSLTSWIPKFLARTNGAAAYADCPQQFSWGSLKVEYPRGLWYPVRPFKDRAFRDPQFQMNLAWSTANRYLANVVKSFRPDVVYAHHTAVNGFFAERLRSRFQVPFVITDHDFGEIADCARWPARRSFFAQIVSKAFTMVFPASRM